MSSERRPRLAALAPYARPDARRALLDVVTSVVPYLGLMAATLALVNVSDLAVLALAVPPDEGRVGDPVRQRGRKGGTYHLRRAAV